jgi:hypothetical protein
MFGSLEALGLKIAAIARNARGGRLARLIVGALGRTQARRAAREIAAAAPGD